MQEQNTFIISALTSCSQSYYNTTWCSQLMLSMTLLLLMFRFAVCFELSNATTPTPYASSRSYNRRHYPVGCVHGEHCSSPQSLANIINNRSASLSLHLCCLLPPALKPRMHGGLRLLPIDCGGERGEGERQGEREWGSALFP